MDETAKLSPAVTQEIANLLGMLDVPQTRRMACAVVANAMVFHDRIAVIHPEIKALNRLWESDTDNPQARVAEEWTAILKINYWPIFRGCQGHCEPAADTCCRAHTGRAARDGPEHHFNRSELRA